MTSDSWTRSTTGRVAAQVKRLRGKETVQQLSDRTAELGPRISRSRLSDLERGDRGGPLGLAEFLLLAEALDVPPLLLLYPGMPGGEVDVLPGLEVSSWAAAQWFRGNRALSQGEDDAAQSKTRRPKYYDGGWLIRLADEEAELLRLLEEIRVVRMTTKELTESMRQRESAAARLRDVRRQIESLGGHPSPWPDGVIDAEWIAGLVDRTKADQ